MGDQEFIEFLNKNENLAIKSSIEFFDRHSLPILKERIELFYLSDFGIVRHLIHMWIEIFKGDESFIEFYEGVYKHRRVPHYEDAISFLILIASIVIPFLSQIFGVEYQMWTKKRKVEEGIQKSVDINKTLIEFEYFIKAYSLRNAYYFGKISETEFHALKEYLFNSLVLGTARENKEKDEKIKSIWVEFNSGHKLPLGEELLKEFEQINSEVTGISSQPVEINFTPTNYNVIDGLSASAGKSLGVIKHVSGLKDISKVEKGDIIFFKNNSSGPDYVRAIKKSTGTIVSKGYGGMTGHVAIVSRELDI